MNNQTFYSLYVDIQIYKYPMLIPTVYFRESIFMFSYDLCNNVANYMYALHSLSVNKRSLGSLLIRNVCIFATYILIYMYTL